MRLKYILTIVGMTFVGSAALAQITTFGTGFAVPTINGTANVANAATGEIVFDTSDQTFRGNTSLTTTANWTQLSAPYTPAYVGQNSSLKTPASNGTFLSMSGNSITLNGGKWKISGSCHFNHNGSSPGYDDIRCGWKSANGADTATEPADATIQAGKNTGVFDLDSSLITAMTMSAPEIRVDATSSVTIYLVPYVLANSLSNARVSTYIYAERVAN